MTGPRHSEEARTGAEPPFLVHGTGTELVEPDWRPLTVREVEAVLSRLVPGPHAEIELSWRSPRPFAAAAVVSASSLGATRRRYVVKRHHHAVRSAAALAEEHAFAAELGSRGLPVAYPLGVLATTTTAGEEPQTSRHDRALLATGWTYELLQAADGNDLYRDRLSWTSYLGPGHALAAGRMLALLHGAASGFDAPQRRPAPLMCSHEVISGDDLVQGVAGFAASRPGLASYLAERPWRRDLREHLAPWHRSLHAATGAGPWRPSWCHGDWHPSNLLWSGDGPEATAVGVIDFGLSNRASALYDLATAIERATIEWLEPPASRRADTDLVEALLTGYQAERPLDRADRRALAGLLPIVHLEYALSEVWYYHGILASRAGADLAYDGYLLAHADWFAGSEGQRLLHVVAAG